MRYVLILLVGAGAALLLGPGDDFDQGVKSLNVGDADKAIYFFSTAIREGDMSRENIARAYNNRAVAYFKKGLHDRAVADYTMALAMRPQDDTIAQNRAIAYRQMGMVDPQAHNGRRDLALGTGPRLKEKVGMFSLFTKAEAQPIPRS